LEGVAVDAERPFQFTLRQLFAVTTFVAFTLGIGRWTGSAGIVVHGHFILVGWLLWRFARGHLGAVVPSLIGLDLLIVVAVDWLSGADTDLFDLRDLVVEFATFLTIVGLGVFFWRACRKCPHWRSQIALGLLVLAALVVWWAIVPAMGRVAVAGRQARETAANNAAMAKAVAQIEAIRKRLGRLPDESEIDEFLEEPLPRICVDRFQAPIRYRRVSDTGYELSFCYWDIFIYSSSTPSKGWCRIPF
jgi:hypothetical protein